MMQRVTASVSIGWLYLDTWSETYVGGRWLSEVELPKNQWETQAHHDPLAQLLLIASHSLVEIALFDSIQKILKATPGKFSKHERQFAKARFGDVFADWPKELGHSAFDLSIEPFCSVDRLRERRNQTIHFGSALTTLEMARSALFSAVDGSKAITEHLLGPDAFKYDAVLKKYPLGPQPMFSGVRFPN